ncbi:MAG: pilus assembly protein PilM [Phycisphaerales bacterium]
MSLLGFFAGPAIGVDVSARWIAAVQAKAGMLRPWIEAGVCVERTGSGAPDAAELRRFAGVLDRHGFRGSSVVLAASDVSLMTAALELPPRYSGAPVEQLARVELARTHKRDPESFELALWDVPSPARGGGEAGHYVAAALPYADAEAMIDAFAGAGLHVRAVDARSWALARACAPAGASAGLSALLDLGESCAVLALVQAGIVIYQRTVPEAALLDVRTQLTGPMGLEPDVADYVLGGGSETPATLTEQARDAIDAYVEAIAGEARAAFDYLSRRAGDSGVDRLLVMGAGARVPGMVEKLKGAIGVEATVVAPASVADAAPGLVEPSKDPRLTAALGLAIHGE